MLSKLLFTVLIIFFTLDSPAQPQFQISIGGTGVDQPSSIIGTSDGGYAVAGYTQSFGAGNYDFYIVKISSNNNIQWSRTVGGPGNDRAYSILQTTDGGYIVAGGTTSFGAGGDDLYIVKLDANGVPQWNKTVGSAVIDYGYSVIQTTDGGYAVGGYTRTFGAGNYDFLIVKLDISGNLQWSKTFGGTGEDLCYSIVLTADGGYALAGETSSFGSGGIDFYIVKIDAGGTLQWSRTIGGTGTDVAYSIVRATDGGYVIAGKTNSFGAGGYDFYIVKIDSLGAMVWSRTVGGISNDNAYSINQTSDGGFIVTGETYSFGATLNDVYIVKLNGSGILQWSTISGGINGEAGQGIIQTSDGGYAVAGGSTSFGAGNIDFYIVKLNAGGNTCGNASYPTSISQTGGTVGSPTSTVTTPTLTVTLPSPTTSIGGTITTICVVGIQPISNEIPQTFSLSQNYPNPFNPTTKIKFALPKSSFAKFVVYDALGRELETLVNEQLNAGTYETEWNADKYPSGVYFYKLTAGDYTETKKMVLVK